MGKIKWCDCNVTGSGPADCLYLTPPFDLSSKADPTSSYTTNGIAVWIISIPKPPHHDTVETPQRKANIKVYIFRPVSTSNVSCMTDHSPTDVPHV